MSSSYHLGKALPVDGAESVPEGTSLLIAGPSMVGKRELAVRLLAAGHETGDGILCVTTQKVAAKFVDELAAHIASLDRNRVAVVDCSGSDQQRAIQEISTERVASPGDLTGISIGPAKLLKQFAERDVSEVRHGLVSVTSLLQYLDLTTVFKFIHIYVTRIHDMRGLGIFTLDTSVHDSQTVNTIANEFDGVVELRETDDGGREVRVKGLADVSRSWEPF